MDVLFKLTERGEIYNADDAKKYLLEQVPEEDNYFYASHKMQRLETGDTIYFAVEGCVVARGIFDVETKKNHEREGEFVNGYKMLGNIEWLGTKEKIDTDIFKGENSFLYIDNDKKRQEIARVLAARP